MINQLLMPRELRNIAIKGYAKDGRGFVRFVIGVHECENSQYHPEKDCENFLDEPNGLHLKRLLQVYNPLVEFVLFVDFEDRGKRSHLYPRLIPLL
ncbi:hypothetical protein F7734_14010 [Scytonema sp. UIC 10036]|uniref:hypothetical protein n=1 Tax=Scytonema sp. UIC 10036 TaxID=2304196 RepID=UPI0012DAF313|nr:hypothetical protein [Scytonema sp. UIC 10036]MUG93483.1 hypothetical protein [Scytonema sp. UIC 10036]